MIGAAKEMVADDGVGLRRDRRNGTTTQQASVHDTA